MPMNDPDTLPFEDERLTAYLDGELSPAEVAALEADLERDPALRAELDALTSVSAFLADNLPMAAPPDFLDDVLAATAGENVVQLAWYRRPFGIPLEGLAVAAAALLVVYVALPGSGDPEATGVAAGRAAPVTKAEQRYEPDPLPARQYDDDGVAVVEPMQQDEAKEASEAEQLLERDKWMKTAELEKKRKLEESKQAVAEGVDAFDVPAKDAVQDQKVVEEAPATQPLFAQVPYSYAITTDDPAVLAQLAALAARYSGELKGKGDSPLEVEELSGTDAATVVVKIPSHALRDFGKSLAGLGKVRAVPDNSMFAGDPVEVRVSVQLVGRGGIGRDVNALRKRSSPAGYDQLEEAVEGSAELAQ